MLIKKNIFKHLWSYLTDSDYRLKVLLKRLNSKYQSGLRKHFKNWDNK